jgi:hypothetical protein
MKDAHPLNLTNGSLDLALCFRASAPLHSFGQIGGQLGYIFEGQVRKRCSPPESGQWKFGSSPLLQSFCTFSTLLANRWAVRKLVVRK